MSLRSRYHTRGPSWAVRLSSDPLPMPVAPVQVSALDLLYKASEPMKMPKFEYQKIDSRTYSVDYREPTSEAPR